MDLADALTQFERAETNLARAETAWSEMRDLVPDGIAFMSGSEDGVKDHENSPVVITGIPHLRGGR